MDGQGSLMITNIVEGDHGNYVCGARNEHGIATSSAFVTIIGEVNETDTAAAEMAKDSIRIKYEIKEVKNSSLHQHMDKEGLKILFIVLAAFIIIIFILVVMYNKKSETKDTSDTYKRYVLDISPTEHVSDAQYEIRKQEESMRDWMEIGMEEGETCLKTATGNQFDNEITPDAVATYALPTRVVMSPITNNLFDCNCLPSNLDNSSNKPCFI